MQQSLDFKHAFGQLGFNPFSKKDHFLEKISKLKPKSCRGLLLLF